MFVHVTVCLVQTSKVFFFVLFDFTIVNSFVYK